MLRRKDYQHVITLEDTELAQTMCLWRIKEQLALKRGKSKKRQITLHLEIDKKLAKETSEHVKKKT